MKLLIKIIGGLWLSGPRYYWSRFKRSIFERKYKKNIKLPKVKDLKDIILQLRYITWTQDSIWNLFDCVSYPETTFATKKDDCDGFATLAMHLLKQLDITSYYYTYIPTNWKRAHTVCIFRYNHVIYRFDNDRLVASRFTDFEKYKKDRFRDVIVDDLRDINFKKVNLC